MDREDMRGAVLCGVVVTLLALSVDHKTLAINAEAFLHLLGWPVVITGTILWVAAWFCNACYLASLGDYESFTRDRKAFSYILVPMLGAWHDLRHSGSLRNYKLSLRAGRNIMRSRKAKDANSGVYLRR